MSGIPERLTAFCTTTLLLFAASCVTAQPSPWLPRQPVAPVVQLRSLGTIPHDSTAYTQGLFLHDGVLVESTGGYGTSTMRTIEAATGKTSIRVHLPDRYFGEGAARIDDRIYQLTWREGTGFVYDAETFVHVGTFRYDEEGWGLTADGELLVMSDGSDLLRFIHPETFATVRTLLVQDGGHSVRQLNELEWIDGEIWANVLFDDRIAVIDPATGEVVRWVDLHPYLPDSRRYDPGTVSNGIAYDPAGRRVYVTGKLWPHIQVLALPGCEPGE